MLDVDKLAEAYKLNNIPRYPQIGRLSTESVATHSYYVTYFSMQLCEYLGLDSETKYLVLTAALIHDLPEMYTSDVPAPVKLMSPDLSEQLDKLEGMVVSKYFPQYKSVFKELEDKEGLVYLIIKVADTLSVCQYASHESTLGNQNTFSVYQDGFSRYTMYKKKLEDLVEREIDLFER